MNGLKPKNFIVICELENGKIHQVLMNPEQRAMLTELLPGLYLDGIVKISERPLEGIQIGQRGEA